MQQQQAESNSRIQRKMIILSSGKCSTSKAAAAAECSARASMARGWYPARAQRVGPRATRPTSAPSQYVANVGGYLAGMELERATVPGQP